MEKQLPAGMAIRKLRKDSDMTQAQLAAKAEISIQYLRSIEAGYGDISDNVKQRLADALNISVWALWPDVQREVDLYKLLCSVHGNALTIRDAERAMFKEVLSRVSEDQFDELIQSGVQPKDVHRLIRKWAKDLNIEVIK